MKDLAYRSIARQVQKSKVRGAYVGLSAAYTPEIFALLNQNIEDRFVNCQNSSSDWRALLKYQPLIEKAYDGHGVKFDLLYKDILEYMKSNPRSFSIIDLDFMCILSEEKIQQIVEAVNISAKTPATVAVWHTSGRATTNKAVDEIFRPLLFQGIVDRFHISEYDEISYYEGYPMRCDVYTLDRRRYGRRGDLAQQG